MFNYYLFGSDNFSFARTYVYTVDPLITNSPGSENLSKTVSFRGFKWIAMHIK